MHLTADQERNLAAYRAEKEAIRRSYVAGQFVAIHDGRVVANAPDFLAVRQALIDLGINPREALVVQAGVDYPESVVILAQVRQK